MGMFNKLFGGNKAKETNAPQAASKAGANAQGAPEARPEPNAGSAGVADMLVALANMAMASGDYARAAESYEKVLMLEPNEVAQYNLGSLYAQGKGVEQDFVEAGYWFHQAELAGNERAGQLCLKCAVDLTHQDFDEKTSMRLYNDMLRFAKSVYQNGESEREALETLNGLADLHYTRGEYAAAAKLLRATAEFANDGYAQNYLAVLYNTGTGLEKNDLAALYWFDRAVDNGAADVALADRDGILNAYRTNLEPAQFHKVMMTLSRWCSEGSDDVPKDARKAAHWRRIAENGVGR